MQSDLFIDTSFFVALTNKSDTNHMVALDFLKEINKRASITTRPILLETGNTLSKYHVRKTAVALFE